MLYKHARGLGLLSVKEEGRMEDFGKGIVGSDLGKGGGAI